MTHLVAIGAVAAVCAGGPALGAWQVTREAVPGVTNFARVETTVACAGSTTPESMAEIRRLGFASVINLRQASENGANIDGGRAAAAAAGLRYIHLPFNGSSPDPSVVDQFLKVVTESANQPAFIHCATGNRAAAMWMIKRLLVDRWDVEKASTEAAALGLTSSTLKDFVLKYVHDRRG